MSDLAFGLSVGSLRSRAGPAVATSRAARCGRWRMDSSDYTVVSSERLDTLFGDAESGGPVTAKYKFELEVSGDKSKKVWQGIYAEFKKSAKFPGFRKGQVPPFMKVQVTRFTLEEVLSAAISWAMEQNELQPVEGDASMPFYIPPIKELRDGFTAGKDLKFGVEIACVENAKTSDEESSEAPAAAPEAAA